MVEWLNLCAAMREPGGASVSSDKEVTTVRCVALTCGALIGGYFMQVDVDFQVFCYVKDL